MLDILFIKLYLFSLYSIFFNQLFLLFFLRTSLMVAKLFITFHVYISNNISLSSLKTNLNLKGLFDYLCFFLAIYPNISIVLDLNVLIGVWVEFSIVLTGLFQLFVQKCCERIHFFLVVYLIVVNFSVDAKLTYYLLLLRKNICACTIITCLVWCNNRHLLFIYFLWLCLSLLSYDNFLLIYLILLLVFI